MGSEPIAADCCGEGGWWLGRYSTFNLRQVDTKIDTGCVCQFYIFGSFLLESIRSDLECKTKYNKGATRDDWAMDQNEVKSKLSNPYRV